MSQDNGGPAFPVVEYNHDGSIYHQNMGLTLLDYFAIHAPAEVDGSSIETLEDAARFLGLDEKDYIASKHWPQVIVTLRYDFAEAMLAERARRMK